MNAKDTKTNKHTQVTIVYKDRQYVLFLKVSPRQIKVKSCRAPNTDFV